MTRLLIVRHGNTLQPGEIPRRVGARHDLPLTAEGKDQARALGRLFATRYSDIAAIQTGPLRRTQQTTAFIAQALPSRVPIIVAPWLAEIDHGPDEGQFEHDVVTRIGSNALFEWDTCGIPPSGWDVDVAMLKTAWQAIAYQASGKTNIFVTSNGIARFAILALIKTAHWPPLRLRTGAFGAITIEGKTAELEEWDERPPA